MEGERQLYARSEGTAVTLRKLPVSYYGEAFAGKKSDLVSYNDGSRKLKADALCYIEDERTSVTSKVLFRVNPQRIVRTSDSPLVEKIAVGKGELEFRVKDGQMYVCSRNKSGTTTYEISKELARGIAPEEALRNAEASVLADLEMRRRQAEMRLSLANYNRKQLVLERLRKARNNAEIDDETLNGVLKQLAARERDAA